MRLDANILSELNRPGIDAKPTPGGVDVLRAWEVNRTGTTGREAYEYKGPKGTRPK